MKMKGMAATLTVAMLCFAIPVFGGDNSSEENTMNWSDFEPYFEESGLDKMGEFVEFKAISSSMWVPDLLYEEELTDEEMDEGLIAYYDDEEGEKGFSIAVYDFEDDITLDEYADYLKSEEAYTNIEEWYINGFRCYIYDDPENDCRYVCYSTMTKNIIEYCFFPLDDEDYTNTSGIMMMSIK